MAMQQMEFVRDPYRRCEERCRHDLGRGVSVAELLDLETPEPPMRPSVSTAPFGPKRSRPATS